MIAQASAGANPGWYRRQPARAPLKRRAMAAFGSGTGANIKAIDITKTAISTLPTRPTSSRATRRWWITHISNGLGSINPWPRSSNKPNRPVP